MRVVSILGARPQFIKAAPVSRELRSAGHEEYLIHTGQHYDYQMSRIFFEELEVPIPDAELGVGSGSHGQQTGLMMSRIEEHLIDDRPDWVLVYGDTNSTLAGALAACKLGIPIAHVEAGLRSFNRQMPEEHNRVLTDHCAALLLCPTKTAVQNLAQEGITQGVRLVGDTMLDMLLAHRDHARSTSDILTRLELQPKRYVLATIHRAYNADVPQNLANILHAFAKIPEPVVLPLHPRTRARLHEDNAGTDTHVMPSNLLLIDPVSYLDMLALEQGARLIMTDSGGVQKEAFLLGVPCVTLRPETEWVETVAAGMNIVTGVDPMKILHAVFKTQWPTEYPRDQFGSGDAAKRIVAALEG